MGEPNNNEHGSVAAGSKQNDPENLAAPQKGEDPIVAMIGKMGRWQGADSVG